MHCACRQHTDSDDDTRTFLHPDGCAHVNGEPHRHSHEHNHTNADSDGGRQSRDRDENDRGPAGQSATANRDDTGDRDSNTHTDAVAYVDSISDISTEFRKNLMQALHDREAVRRHMHRGG